MNQRFLRWVLNVAHKTEKYYSRGGQNYFFWVEPAVRWNSSMLSVGFAPVPFLLFSQGPDSTESTIEFGLNIASFICLTICVWAVCINMWSFHRNRRHFKKAKQKTRRMLNAVPFCAGFLILLSTLMLIQSLIIQSDSQLMVMFIILSLLIPYLGTRFWVIIATTPFQAGFKKR